MDTSHDINGIVDSHEVEPTGMMDLKTGVGSTEQYTTDTMRCKAAHNCRQAIIFDVDREGVC